MAVGWSRTTECTLDDLNSNLAVPRRPHSEPHCSPSESLLLPFCLCYPLFC
ncbi:hypothetical protein E2C01_049495 [Portunus trituberculatus]|uniref:Uncharacterized protein n=1 Tax=Portunus trituberculatus TaxID=210409 RepID=A0A5B7GG72_PORTR|nr:hypothetical protein [Portunus trituberculatus]